ncbi:MAG: C10 family peptidase [Prevotellaceae bacterium]|nr:C10 family peptidase [Prevotellaceae bacterium]
MIRLFFLFISCCFVLSARSGSINRRQALAMARDFFASGHNISTLSAKDFSASCRLAGETAAAFVIECGTSFVLIGRDDGQPVILGYGSSGNILPGNMRVMLGSIPFPKALPSRQTVAVGPLLTAVRHQRAPYNNLCPYYTDDNGTSTERTVVGCVATAAEEIVSYYRRIVELRDTLHGWTTEHYVIADALPGEAVDCRLIADNYDVGQHSPESVDAVARLSLWCGMAAHMSYGLSESGANIGRLVEPFRRAMGYGYVHYCDSYNYTPEDWRRILDTELDAGRPVLYAGYTQHVGGHAFVVDGRDADGLYHVNWGYGGSYDGYFRLEVLCPFEPADDYLPSSVAAGFFCNQEMLLLHPDEQSVQLPDTLGRSGREVVVTNLNFLLAPETGVYTPLVLSLHNTGSRALTTPLELFTNLPSDTALLVQADVVATTGVTLAPGADTTFVVHALFKREGQRVLRVSPDGETMIGAVTADITVRTGSSAVSCSQALADTKGDTLFLYMTFSNSGSARFGRLVTYALHEGASASTSEPRTHYTYTYIPAGEMTTETVRFLHVEGGKTYTVVCTANGRKLCELTFTLPGLSGLPGAVSSQGDMPESWFTLDGRPATNIRRSGVYIRRRGSRTEKVCVSTASSRIY